MDDTVSPENIYQGALDQLKEDEATIRRNMQHYKKLLDENLRQQQNIFNKLKLQNPKISDHAIVRYLERVAGFDVGEIRKGLLTDNVIKAIQLGAKTIKSNGLRFVVEKGTIVTIIKESET